MFNFLKKILNLQKWFTRKFNIKYVPAVSFIWILLLGYGFIAFIVSVFLLNLTLNKLTKNTEPENETNKKKVEYILIQEGKIRDIINRYKSRAIDQ